MVVFKLVPKTSILKISNFWVLSFAFRILLKFQHKCNSGSGRVPGAEGADIQWCFILPPLPKRVLRNEVALPGWGKVPMLERALTAGLHLERLFKHHDRYHLVWEKPGSQLSLLKLTSCVWLNTSLTAEPRWSLVCAVPSSLHRRWFNTNETLLKINLRFLQFASLAPPFAYSCFENNSS